MSLFAVRHRDGAAASPCDSASFRRARSRIPVLRNTQDSFSQAYLENKLGALSVLAALWHNRHVESVPTDIGALPIFGCQAS
eukprot:5038045-Alexandrium_andersonii.AAC.1